MGVLLWLLLHTPSAPALQAPPPAVPAVQAYTGIRYYVENPYGVYLVADVEAGSPAEQAGVKKGDVILAVVYQGTVYSYPQALRLIPPDGFWEPRPVYPPSARMVELILRRRVERPRPFWEGLKDEDFETLVVWVRWAAARSQSDP
ncbi:MAG: PDZ domain-containing protein [Bacillota bacterium]